MDVLICVAPIGYRSFCLISFEVALFYNPISVIDVFFVHLRLFTRLYSVLPLFTCHGVNLQRSLRKHVQLNSRIGFAYRLRRALHKTVLQVIINEAVE